MSFCSTTSTLRSVPLGRLPPIVWLGSRHERSLQYLLRTIESLSSRILRAIETSLSDDHHESFGSSCSSHVCVACRVTWDTLLANRGRQGSYASDHRRVRSEDLFARRNNARSPRGIQTREVRLCPVKLIAIYGEREWMTPALCRRTRNNSAHASDPFPGPTSMNRLSRCWTFPKTFTRSTRKKSCVRKLSGRVRSEKVEVYGRSCSDKPHIQMILG